MTQSRSFAESWPKIWWCHGLTNQKPIRFAVYFCRFFWFVCLHVSSCGFLPTFSPLPQLDRGQSTAIHQPMTSFLPRILDFGFCGYRDAGDLATEMLAVWQNFTILLAAKITRAKKSEMRRTCDLFWQVPIQGHPFVVQDPNSI